MKYYKQAIFFTFITMCSFLQGMEKTLNPLYVSQKTLYSYLNLSTAATSDRVKQAFEMFCETNAGKKLEEIRKKNPTLKKILTAYSILSTPELKESYDNHKYDLEAFFKEAKELEFYETFNILEVQRNWQDADYNATVTDPKKMRPRRLFTSEETKIADLTKNYLELTQKFSPYRFYDPYEPNKAAKVKDPSNPSLTLMLTGKEAEQKIQEAMLSFKEAEERMDKVKTAYLFLSDPETRKIYHRNRNQRSFLVGLLKKDALKELKKMVNPKEHSLRLNIFKKSSEPLEKSPSSEHLASSPQSSRSLSLTMPFKKSPESEKKNNSLTTALVETFHHVVGTTKGSKLAKRSEIGETSFQQPIKSIETADSPKNDEKEL